MRSVWPCCGWGLACCALLPGARCALTAPFHPCPCRFCKRPSAVLLSAPLSVALPRPAVSRHPALCSPDFPPRMPYAIRGDCLSDPCAARIIAETGRGRLKVSDGLCRWGRGCGASHARGFGFAGNSDFVGRQGTRASPRGDTPYVRFRHGRIRYTRFCFSDGLCR